MKFGGTSVQDASRIAHVATLARSTGQPVVVVTSAMGGATDALLAAGRAAESGALAEALEAAASLRARHHAVPAPDAAHARVDQLCDELEDLLRGVALLGEQTPRSRATLAAFGERLAIPLVSGAVEASGGRSVPVDAADLLVTDDRWESASVDLVASREKARAVLMPALEEGVLPVVTGFVGATRDGRTTVLGRGGSDWSAAILGACLDADEVWIWTDVDGILSADPRLVRDARTLDRVSYREAAEMSYFGAKVIHPKTMAPAMARGIPIRIRSTFHPERDGTLIAAETSEAPFGVKTVTAVRRQALLTVEGRGMAGLPGIARRIFGCAEDAGANVVMISQASSEQAVSFVVDGADAPHLVRALGERFSLEIDAGLLAPPRVQDDVAVVSAVGEGMAGHPGVSARLFDALGRTGVNVLAIAQGATEMSISAAISESDVPRAVRAVHTAFGLTQILDLFLVGAGRVGRALLPMLEATRRDLLRTHRVELRVVGAATSRRLLLEEEGIAPSELVGRLEEAGPRGGDADLLDRLEGARHGPLVLVDVTAADTLDLHHAALQRGFHVVTANKRPLSGPLLGWHRLVDAVRSTGARYGYETTFGAGLPVLHTLKELLHTGDEVEEVSGCFSGTLGYLCTELQDGVPLVDAVGKAEALGYTEPDPREDLSGRDVARKALIIARAMGLELEPEDVALEAMVPDLEEGLDVAMARHGEAMAARVAEAAERGEVLRYVATIRTDRVEVGLRAVAADGPIGSLRGPDNILVFRSHRYRDYPLVVRGPGAGAEVTAAGVLGDVIRVASGAR